MNPFISRFLGRGRFALSVICAAILTGSPSKLQSAQLTAWGQDKIDTPTDLPDVVSIALDGNHALAVNRNGTVTGWGSNYAIPADLTNAVGVAADWKALLDNGSGGLGFRPI